MVRPVHEIPDPQASIADEDHEFFFRAAHRIADTQVGRLVDAWQQHTGQPVSPEMRQAFRNIVWQCSGTTVNTLAAEFSKPT